MSSFREERMMQADGSSVPEKRVHGYHRSLEHAGNRGSTRVRGQAALLSMDERGVESSFSGHADDQDAFHDFSKDGFVSPEIFMSKRLSRKSFECTEARKKTEMQAMVDMLSSLNLSMQPKSQLRVVRKVEQAVKLSCWMHPPELRELYARVISVKKKSSNSSEEVNKVLDNIAESLMQLDLQGDLRHCRFTN